MPQLDLFMYSSTQLSLFYFILFLFISIILNFFCCCLLTGYSINFNNIGSFKSYSYENMSFFWSCTSFCLDQKIKLSDHYSNLSEGNWLPDHLNNLVSFQTPASRDMASLICVHNDIYYYLQIISFIVFWFIAYTLYNNTHYFLPLQGDEVNKTTTDLGLVSEAFDSCSALEVIWTILPSFFLLMIGYPGISLLYSLDERVYSDFFIKIIGRQWYWTYEYPEILYDNNRCWKYDSVYEEFDYWGYELDSKKTEQNKIYLELFDSNLNANYRYVHVNLPLFLIVDTPITAIVTSSDVIHSWAVPALGIKVDACPGRLNQIQFEANAVTASQGNGLLPIYFWGQCSEFCGIGHGFMPIVVRCVSLHDYFPDIVLEMTRSKIGYEKGMFGPYPEYLSGLKIDSDIVFDTLELKQDIEDTPKIKHDDIDNMPFKSGQSCSVEDYLPTDVPGSGFIGSREITCTTEGCSIDDPEFPDFILHNEPKACIVYGTDDNCWHDEADHAARCLAKCGKTEFDAELITVKSPTFLNKISVTLCDDMTKMFEEDFDIYPEKFLLSIYPGYMEDFSIETPGAKIMLSGAYIKSMILDGTDHCFIGPSLFNNIDDEADIIELHDGTKFSFSKMAENMWSAGLKLKADIPETYVIGKDNRIHYYNYMDKVSIRVEMNDNFEIIKVDLFYTKEATKEDFKTFMVECRQYKRFAQRLFGKELSLRPELVEERDKYIKKSNNIV